MPDKEQDFEDEIQHTKKLLTALRETNVNYFISESPVSIEDFPGSKFKPDVIVEDEFLDTDALLAEENRERIDTEEQRRREERKRAEALA